MENCCPEYFGYVLTLGIVAGTSLILNCILCCYKKCEKVEDRRYIRPVIPMQNVIIESKGE